MTRRRVGRSRRTLTAAETSRMRYVRQEVEAEKEEIIRRGREVFATHEQAMAQTIGALKNARESMGLTLQQVAERMGTDRANVHRLENTPGNPTVATLARYAEAVGKRIVIALEDAMAR